MFSVGALEKERKSQKLNAQREDRMQQKWLVRIVEVWHEIKEHLLDLEEP